MLCKKLIPLVLLITFQTNLFPQSSTITLDDAIKLAIERNNQIKIASIEVTKAQHAVKEAFGYALPSLDLSGNFSHFISKPKMAFPDFEALLTNAAYGILFKEDVIPYDEGKFLPMDTKLQSFAQTNNYEVTAQLTQVLFNSAVFRGIGTSQVYLDLSKEQLNSVVASTILNVKKAFYGALLTRNVLEITKESFKNAQDNLSNVKALREKGFVSEFDALQAEVQVENIRPLVLQIENSLKTLKENLKILLGIDMAEEIELSGELNYVNEEIPGKNIAIERALGSNFDLKTLLNKREFDDALVDLERADYYPNLAAFGSYGLAGSSDNWKFQNYSSSLVGLAFSINLFRGTQSSNRVQQANLTVKQTDEQISQLKLFIITQVKEKILELERVKSLIDVQEKNVKLAERAYEISLVRYKEGAGNQLEVQNADIALRQARTNRLQSVFSYISAKSELEQIMGIIKEEYLTYINELINK
ncbi:MAG: TolC family protein [Ignavibacteriaceae bacterium]